MHSYHLDDASRVLPHEAWLAHALGLAGAPQRPRADAPLAVAAMRGCGLGAEAQQGHWFVLQPIHVQISRTHMLLAEPRLLRLAEEESRALFALALPYVQETGKTLLYGGPDLWFLRADDWAGLSTASPDAVVSQSLSDWLPSGEQARAFRRLQNEVQMLWHEHAVNEARQARGLQPVNSLWLWGGANALTVTAAQPAVGITAAAGLPAWMSAVSAPALRQVSAAQLVADGRDAAIMLADLIPDAQAGDWGMWLQQLQRLDTEWLAPLLAALRAGSIGRLALVLGHRDDWIEVGCSRYGLYQFWRKPSLSLLGKAA
ncbi:hypothetical protein ACLB1G_02115 [Oxalobacteraceae bacterium A2-2]